MSIQYFSKNGKLLPLVDATVPLENIAYQYGFGVYETIRVRNKIAYFTEQHIERLLQSARLIELEHIYTLPQIDSYIQEVIQKNNTQNCNLKILLIGGKNTEDALLFILPLNPLFPDKKIYINGVTVETAQYERFLPNAKTLNMLQSYIHYTKASKKGHYDALFLDDKNNVLEGSRTNFFVIKDKTLITPPKEKVLAGVTRQTVIAVAKKSGFIVEEKGININELENFDGAFLTATSAKIVPLIQINDFKFDKIPENLNELMRMYSNFLEKSNGLLIGKNGNSVDKSI
jgi:branched-chain amino acid aminotransferase